MLISIVTVAYEPCAELVRAIECVTRNLEQNFQDFEVVIVCPRPGTVTNGFIDDLLKREPSIRFLQLANLVARDVAVAAGLENAIGDFVITLDWQRDPPECIPQLIKQATQSGSEVVIGVSGQPRTITYRIVRPWISRTLTSIGYTLPQNATDLRCLSRNAVNCVTSTGRYHHQLYVRISRSGFLISQLSYQTVPSYKLGKKNFVIGVSEVLRLMVFNSTRPLRWMSLLGITGSGLAFIFACYSMVIRFFKNNVIEGWTSLVIFMSALFFLLFMIMAFFGEYLGRLLEDRSEHREYSIAVEKRSSVMLNAERVNVALLSKK